MAEYVQPPSQAPDLKLDTRTDGQGLGEVSGEQTDGKHPDQVAKLVNGHGANGGFKEGKNGMNGSGRSDASVVKGWRYLNKDGFAREPLKIVIAGGGAAGICLGIKLLEAQKDGRLGHIDLTIYERDQDYGGTWHANRYPGCRCDIPSHVYQFGFAPYADWPQFYSSSKEINKYMHVVAQKFGVEPLIKCNRTIKSAIYSDETAKWTLEVETKGSSMETIEVDIYVPATGVLSQVNRPNIPGLEAFPKNRVLHTAEWPADLDYQTAFKDENVAVVGIGSSGLQTIGAIAPFAKSVSIFARSKFWISPPLLAETAGAREWKGGNFYYSDAEKEQFATDEDALYKHDSTLSAATMHLFDVFFKGSAEQEGLKAIVRDMMTADLRDPDLIAQLVPDIHLPTVSLLMNPIEKVSKQAITTKNGQQHKIDRIILATGFDTSFKPKYPLRGKKGVDLGDVWKTRPKGFPNMFIMCGPGTVFANGSLLAGIEANAKYIVDAVAKMQSQDIKSMEIAQENQDEYNRQQDSLMADLVFTSHCSSWYKSGRPDAPPDALFAGSTLQFMELLASPRWEDWEYEYRHENKFSFLGKGTSTVEGNGGDRAFYLTKEMHRNPLRMSDYREPANGAVPLNI
ncbi:hypothetical protein QFC22_005145 [Naganishia vaughanmartiniae]|uniref:Uncharacterized protein n=1 Tax=Naganishia vaughanmartiniae TaxID=1424756 RepID=A0ACC2WUE0_9TREE|nr:hypothetical protein QFC22_005145 [Naganishia vaughanmartiniae]